MTSRNQILQAIEQHPVAEVVHPGVFDRGVIYDDPLAQFAAVLGSVGGRCEITDDVGTTTSLLDAIPEYRSAEVICSLVEGMGRSSIEVQEVDDPHHLAEVDFAILPGELAVAENAAIWVTTADVRVRTLYFLTQHLILVVPRDKVVSNMHQAYELIDVTSHSFGTWISGPSKTADIEQSLVKGAHGARSLFVLVTN